MQVDLIDSIFQTYHRTLITRSRFKHSFSIYSDRLIASSYCLDAVQMIPTSSSLISEEYVSRGDE